MKIKLKGEAELLVEILQHAQALCQRHASQLEIRASLHITSLPGSSLTLSHDVGGLNERTLLVLCGDSQIEAKCDWGTPQSRTYATGYPAPGYDRSILLAYHAQLIVSYFTKDPAP